MNKYMLLLLVGLQLCSNKLVAQHPQITQQDSLEILEKAGLKIMFFEATLNYLADPYSKAKSVIARKSYEPSFEGRVFWDQEVLLAEDLTPALLQNGESDIQLTVPQYLEQFQQVYQTDDPKSVVFRVSKIKTLLRKKNGLYVEVFFDRALGGSYKPEKDQVYPTSYHLAMVKIVKSEGEWQGYVTSIRQATAAEQEYYIPEDYKRHVAKMPHLQEKGQ